MKITTKDCKEAIKKWIATTKKAGDYYYGFTNGNIKRIWKRKTQAGNIIRAFYDDEYHEQIIYVIEHNNTVIVTPNHPDITWKFHFDELHQDSEYINKVIFEFYPVDNELAESLGYTYGALQYLFNILPVDADEIMENSILLDGEKEEITQMLLSLGFQQG